MLPTWIITTAVVIGGCIAAYFVGSGLSGFENPWFAGELVVISAIAILCAIYNNFPFLYAMGFWLPFTGYKSVPDIAVVCLWIGAVLFFRLCKKGSIAYVRSFDWIPLLILSWVFIRFSMNPVMTLGATIGGSGVSGAMPYFLTALDVVIFVFTGAVLSTRERLMQFMRLQFWVVTSIGCFLGICAFIPATGPVLHALGFFNAGDLGDGIQRIVLLPGYGVFMLQAALCPACFRLRRAWVPVIIILALAFMVIGGNRSGIMSACFAVPVALILRKKPVALMASGALLLLMMFILRISVANMSVSEVPPMLRSFGVFDSKIDEAGGGTGSAQWRYEVWESAWGKIMENPLIGKGFGHLPQRFAAPMVPSATDTTTDFEATLAGGMEHNGFIVAAYGYGLPFMVLLTLCMAYYTVRAAYGALASDRHDLEARDAYAFFACVLASLPVGIYAANDLHSFLRTATLVVLLANLQRRSSPEAPVAADASARGYGYQPYAAAPYRY
jgi:hypothetical protein